MKKAAALVVRSSPERLKGHCSGALLGSSALRTPKCEPFLIPRIRPWLGRGNDMGSQVAQAPLCQPKSAPPIASHLVLVGMIEVNPGWDYLDDFAKISSRLSRSICSAAALEMERQFRVCRPTNMLPLLNAGCNAVQRITEQRELAPRSLTMTRGWAWKLVSGGGIRQAWGLVSAGAAISLPGRSGHERLQSSAPPPAAGTGARA